MRIIFTLIIVFFFNSCNDTIKNIKREKKELIINENSKKPIISQEGDDYKEPEFMLKLQNQTDLNEDDYNKLIIFLKNNIDESMSENLGFLLFQYFKGRTERNKNFIKIIKNSDKERVYVLLIKTMCIDIIDEDYKDINEFINDFPMFIDNSDIIKKTYNFCLENK